MKDALDALIRLHGRSSNHAQVATAKAVYAASSTLARQIERGAPADIFIAADVQWMDYLVQRKLIHAASRINLLSNRLVLIAPATRPSRLLITPGFALAQALGDGRLAMADPASVPAGKYGKAALRALGVWDALERKVAPAENVRAALMLVARGETPFGVVYASDAFAEPRVRVQGTFPANTHAPIVYPAALVMASHNARAQAWLDVLRSREARTVWRQYGFGVPD